jgi:AcrR family transcriptional regulator
MATKASKIQRRKPRQARARATCEAILEAASQILERDGAAGFNTNAVAERAGVSIGTLYQYFPDKTAILLAAAQRESTQSAPASRLAALLQALVGFWDALRPDLAAPVASPQARPRRRSAKQVVLSLRWAPAQSLSPLFAPIRIRAGDRRR